MLSLFSTARYAFWRFSVTYHHLAASGFSNISWDFIFPTLLLIAEIYAIMVLGFGHFGSLKPLDRNPIPLPPDPADWPDVDVYVPSYNEPLEIVRPTVLAAMGIDWPPEKMKVYILDDGRREEFREFAEECGCGYLTRTDNKGAKAGNINAAMKKTSGEFIAIFDCDHVPTRSFLQMTMGWFLVDPDLAMVQTPHYFYTPDPFEKNLGLFKEVPNEGALFYGVVQNCSDFWNATFFCGSCAAIRRTALDEVGGIAVETVTEDAHTALKMQRRGWNTAYIRFPQAAGLATASLGDHIGQRIRWARGMVQILRIDCPLFGKGLTWPQRLCYTNSTLHYLYGFPRLIFLTAPLVYLILNRSNVFGYYAAILAYAFPHLALATLTNSRIQGQYRHSFWNEVYETVLAPYILLPTTLALISPKHGKFNVTPKSQSLDQSAAMPFIGLLALNLTGILLGGLRMVTEPERQGALMMNMFWATVNCIILGASVAVAGERQQRRQEARLERHYAVRLVLEDGESYEGETTDLSNSGAALTLEEAADVPEGSYATIEFLDPEDVRLAIEVVKCEGKTVRSKFREMDMAQRQILTRLIFAGADLWISGLRAKEQDHPGKSFLRILTVSMRGMAMIPKAMFRRPEVSAPPPARKRRPRTPAGRAGKPALPLVALLLAGLAATAWHAQAAPRPAKKVEPAAQVKPPAPGFDDVRTFVELGQRQPLNISGPQGQAVLNFTLPLSKVATEAHLGLNYRLAPVLDPNKTELQFTLNGAPIGSLALGMAGTAGNTLNHAELAVPAELLVIQNTLTMQLRSQCRAACSPDEGEIRTVIDPTSSLHLSGEVIPWPNDLSLLPSPFFDPQVQLGLELGFLLPQEADPQLLRAAGVIASYFGGLANHRNARFTVSNSDFPKGNCVVFISAEYGDLTTLKLPPPTAPTVAIRDNPSDPAGKVLVIGGKDSAQVLQAAQSVAAGLGQKQGDFGTFEGGPPARTTRPYDAPRWLKAGRVVLLGENTPQEQLRVENQGEVHWYFRLPPDLHFGQRDGVPLRLHYRFAPLPADSRAEVRIHINGVAVSTKRFNGGNASESVRDIVELPAASLYPSNTLTVEFQHFDRAALATVPVASVLRDSELDLSGIPHFTSVPRLDLFAKAGFPFTRTADLSGVAVVLPERPSIEESRFYLELMGFLSAQTGTAGTQIDVMDTQRAMHTSDRDLIVIGTAESMPLFGAWNQLMPVRIGKTEFAINPPDSTWLRLWAMPLTPYGRETGRLKERLAAAPVPEAVLQAFVSPLNSQRCVLAISARTPQSFEPLLDTIDKSVQEERIFGTVSLMSGGTFESFRVLGASYDVGELGIRDAIDFWVYRYMWFVPFVVILLGLVLANMTAGWVERQVKERLSTDE